MVSQLRKRISTFNNGNGEEVVTKKIRKEEPKKKTVSNPKVSCPLLGLPMRVYRHLATWLDDIDVRRLAATCSKLKKSLDDDAVWRKLYEVIYKDYSPKLNTADHWRSHVEWSRSKIIHSDASLFGDTTFNLAMDPKMHGMRKICFSEECIFALDMAGTVHVWDEEDCWKKTPLTNVVDITTDAYDTRRERTSLFVLSQSPSMISGRPKLINYLKYQKRVDEEEFRYDRWFENKGLTLWHTNGAPRAGDHVDVFRITDLGRLRRVFKMSFQQNHKFLTINVSNRDYTATVNLNEETRNKHVNEVQMMTTKGRVWAITVNEPNLLASGGGAQVSLRNLTSRFDTVYDEVNMCLAKKVVNGPYITGLLTQDGNLNLFSDQNIRMMEMFYNRPMFKTECSKLNDTEDYPCTERLSTIMNIGCEIEDVSISISHILIVDVYGRLWVVGQNRHGELGTGNQHDQSKPVRIALPKDVKKVLSVCASTNMSGILVEAEDGSREVYCAGHLRQHTFMGYDLVGDLDDDSTYDRYLCRRPRNINTFTQVEVALPDMTDKMHMSTNHVSFTVRHGPGRAEEEEMEPADLGESKSSCSACEDFEPWNHFSPEYADKTPRWILEKIERCTCLAGNGFYTGLLLSRLSDQRMAQRALVSEESLDFELDQDFDKDIDELIEAITFAHSLRETLPQ